MDWIAANLFGNSKSVRIMDLYHLKKPLHKFNYTNGWTLHVIEEFITQFLSKISLALNKENAKSRTH